MPILSYLDVIIKLNAAFLRKESLTITSTKTEGFLPCQAPASTPVCSATAKSDKFTFSQWNSKQRKHDRRKIFGNSFGSISENCAKT